LPPQVGSTIDSLLSGKGGDIASAANLLGGLLDSAKKKK